MFAVLIVWCSHCRAYKPFWTEDFFTTIWCNVSLHCFYTAIWATARCKICKRKW